MYSKGTPQQNHVQLIQFNTSTVSTGDALTITFADLYGAEWTTRPIITSDDSWQGLSQAIEDALEALPNQVVKDVSVSETQGVSDTVRFGYTVEFNANTGTQNLLVLNTDGCEDDGCQPRINGLSGVSAKKVSTQIFTGTTEANECSGRGNCDSETGICECTEGFTGEACEQQTVLL
jgi:hypothetical protein